MIGLHYNYFRDYNPATGRYVQSVPIGLEGGINTYAYVEGNPLALFDFYGLAPCSPKKLAALQLAVNAACKWIGPRRCEKTDSCTENGINIGKNSACAAARRTINQLCFKGGDEGHKEAEQAAINAVKRCLELRPACCKD